MRYFFILLSLVMLSFVYVQYNDPDPVIWMCIYGYSVIMLLFAANNKFPIVPILIGMVGYFTGAALLFPSVIEWITKEHGQNLMQRMNNTKMYIEETRECGGLIIAFLMMLILFFFSLKTKKGKSI